MSIVPLFGKVLIKTNQDKSNHKKNKTNNNKKNGALSAPFLFIPKFMINFFLID